MIGVATLNFNGFIILNGGRQLVLNGMSDRQVYTASLLR